MYRERIHLISAELLLLGRSHTSRGTAAREMSWALTLLLVFALLGQRGAGAQDVAEGQMIDRLVADHVLRPVRHDLGGE